MSALANHYATQKANSAKNLDLLEAQRSLSIDINKFYPLWAAEKGEKVLVTAIVEKGATSEVEFRRHPFTQPFSPFSDQPLTIELAGFRLLVINAAKKIVAQADAGKPTGKDWGTKTIPQLRKLIEGVNSLPTEKIKAPSGETK